MVSKWAFVRWDIFVMRNKRVLGYLHIILFYFTVPPSSTLPPCRMLFGALDEKMTPRPRSGEMREIRFSSLEQKIDKNQSGPIFPFL